MTSIRKFQFETSFDVDEPGAPGRARRAARNEEPPPPPPPPTFSEAQLASVRAEAYAAGEAAGRAAGIQSGRNEAEARIENRLGVALGCLAQDLGSLIAEREAINAERTKIPVRIALRVIERVLPALAHRHGLGEIEAMVGACLIELVDEPRLTIRVAEELVGEVRPRLEAIAGQRGFAGRLSVIGDPSFGPADARLEWAEGGVERNTEALLAEVGRAADRLIGTGTGHEG